MLLLTLILIYTAIPDKIIFRSPAPKPMPHQNKD
jgi:hypothetical protein